MSNRKRSATLALCAVACLSIWATSFAAGAAASPAWFFNGAELTSKETTLNHAGISSLTVPGLTTKLMSSTAIRHILTRHEQAASFMAEMYGRVTGRAAVVSATLGPGAINMQLGVADATTNSTPPEASVRRMSAAARL